MNNWPIYNDDGQAVTVGAASAPVLVVASSGQGAAVDVMIDNPGPLDVYVKAGGADVVATLQSMRVPAYSMQPFRKGPHHYLGMRTVSGTQPVVVHVGEGQ
jgi:hypothetical protein